MLQTTYSVILDDDFDRNCFCLVLMCYLCMEYLSENGLRRGDKQHEAIMSSMARIVFVLSFGYQVFDQSDMCRCLDEGTIPMNGGWLTFGAEDGICEIPKGSFERFMRLAMRVLYLVTDDEVRGDFGAMCETAAEHLVEAAWWHRRRRRPAQQNDRSDALDFDL
jgi:hypothetical protein